MRTPQFFKKITEVREALRGHELGAVDRTTALRGAVEDR